MAAGLGFKTFTSGEVLTAADTNGYLMQGILVFATEAARNSAITSPQEGQFAFTKDTNSLWYYTGSAWAASGATGDIEGVTAGTGITGGGTSGTVTITNDMATTITAAGDIVVGTGSGTYDNLPIGTTAQILTADTTVSPYKVKWAAPAAASPIFIGAVAYTNTSQNLSSGVPTALTLGSEEADTDGYHSTVTNTSRMTVPTGKGGAYLLDAVVYFNGNSSFSFLYFYKNGAAITNGVHEGQVYASGITDIKRTVSLVVTGAVATDYFELFAAGDGSPVKQKARLAFTYLGA